MKGLKWFFLMIVPVLVNILMIWVGIDLKWSPAVIVMVIGIFSFFAMLGISGFVSGNQNLLEGEMRKAIATSMIMVYFAILSFTLIDSEIALTTIAPITSFSLETVEDGTVETSSSLLSDFSTLIAVVIGFYFGGRTFEEVVKTWKG